MIRLSTLELAAAAVTLCCVLDCAPLRPRGVASSVAIADSLFPHLDSLIGENSHLLTSRDGRLAGPAADLLQRAAEGTRFVAMGENHNTRAIPEFTVGLFRMLHDTYGFQYLALEEGPALGELLSRRMHRGVADAAFVVGREYPNAFHMYTEEELRMMDRVAAISQATQPIWGLNQEFGLLHVLDRLITIAPNEAARRAAEAMREECRKYEGERFARGESYISVPARGAQLAALHAAFVPAPGSEAERLLAQATLSHEIYLPYVTKPRPSDSTFARSSEERERNMESLLVGKLADARTAGDTVPRVLVKSGHTHITRMRAAGYRASTLGDGLADIAARIGGRTLTLYVLLHWDELNEGSFATFMRHAPDGVNTVIDLRPIRAWAAARRYRGLDAELRRVIGGADMLVLLAGDERGSLDALRTPHFHHYSE
ncbi:MAG: hypothetical protein JWM95_4088 [Gemmatimonadetes bacterium]|nr:hypothetical protein [Gemmatimonadota bacterium]